MSHNKERKEKICLNCNAHIYGRYCHICGQENIEVKQTFWHLVTHFVYDITHFDGKFFSTLKYLLFRPGFLSHEYIRGRRASYLDPIRMYVFTSAIFFLIFFSFVHAGNSLMDGKDNIAATGLKNEKKNLQEQLKNIKDTTEKKQLSQAIDSLGKIISAIDASSSGQAKESDTSKTGNDSLQVQPGIVITGSLLPPSVAAYDSAQNKLPPDKRDGWVTRMMERRVIAITKEYHNNRKEFFENLTEKFFHSFPEMMFVSLPLVALILQLLYIRRRKQFYYVNHGVFTIHLYIALYILLLVYYLFGALLKITGWHFFDILQILTILSMFFYMYKAMHNFYGQGRLKTFFKMLIFDFLYFFVLTFLVTVFFISSLFQI